MNGNKSVAIAIIILIIVFSAGYLSNKVIVAKTSSPSITIVDTVYVEGKAIITEVVRDSVVIDTIFIETIINGVCETITKVDTIFINSKELIASIDTTFYTSDKLVRNDLNIKYYYAKQTFWIKNTITRETELQIDRYKPLLPLSYSIYTIGNNNSLSLGFGLLYDFTKNIRLGVGYSTDDSILLQLQVQF